VAQEVHRFIDLSGIHDIDFQPGIVIARSKATRQSTVAKPKTWIASLRSQ
jgi:hypothetical protein